VLWLPKPPFDVLRLLFDDLMHGMHLLPKRGD
jgi:hypothetical protein